MTFWFRYRGGPMPLLLKHGNQPEYRDEVVCKFSATFTVRKSIFSDGRFWSNFWIFIIFRHFSKFLDRIQAWKRSESFRVVCVKDKGPRYPWESGPHVRILTKSQQNLWFVSKILGAATPRHQNTILKNSPGMVGLLALRKRFPTHWKRSKIIQNHQKS